MIIIIYLLRHKNIKFFIGIFISNKDILLLPSILIITNYFFHEKNVFSASTDKKIFFQKDITTNYSKLVLCLHKFSYFQNSFETNVKLIYFYT